MEGPSAGKRHLRASSASSGIRLKTRSNYNKDEYVNSQENGKEQHTST